MWLLLSSRPRLPAWQFKGRRAWSAADAIFWPALVGWLATRFVAQSAFGGLWSFGIPLLFTAWGLRRLSVALLDPLAYVFTTWTLLKWMAFALVAVLLMRASL